LTETETVPHAGKTRVLILTGDPIGTKMAGPAIRAWNIALALSAEHDVLLVTTTQLERIPAPFKVRLVRPREQVKFGELEQWADVVLFQGHAMASFPALQASTKVIVADIYDPMHLEQLEQGEELPRGTWELNVQTATRVLNQQLAIGDFFLCASERQRPFYLGQLASLGRINPANYEHDRHLESLLAVAPFGLSAEPPKHVRQVLKGVVPGIGPDDKVLIWGGGVYNWFDPKTLIRAMAEVGKKHDNVRLFFLGTKHPSVDEMAIVRESRELSAELGLTGKSVFFNATWVAFDERANYLLESDAGVSTHKLHVETTFSFRTRILDYLWAGLPIIATEGDSFADLIEDEGLGVVVEARNVRALARAIEKVLFDEKFLARTRANVARVRERFIWSNALEPLLVFMRNPRRAPDRVDAPAGALVQTPGQPSIKAYPTHGLGHDLRMMQHHLMHGGVGVVASKLWGRLRSVVRR
jgi:glycosyltransferase involved in cell wall biosynthesis